MTAFVEPELFAAMHEVANRNFATIGDTISQACRELVRKHQSLELSQR
jgi:hypothetical protein